MRFSRTHLVPVLAIVAGGVIGASFSFGVLARSRSVDVSVSVPVSATYESVEVFLERERFKEALRLLEQEPLRVLMEEQNERVRLRIRFMSEFGVEEPIVGTRLEEDRTP